MKWQASRLALRPLLFALRIRPLISDICFVYLRRCREIANGTRRPGLVTTNSTKKLRSMESAEQMTGFTSGEPPEITRAYLGQRLTALRVRSRRSCYETRAPGQRRDVTILMHRVFPMLGPMSGMNFFAQRGHSYNRARRSRRALPITETELKLIAAAAIIGLSRIPKKG